MFWCTQLTSDIWRKHCLVWTWPLLNTEWRGKQPGLKTLIINDIVPHDTVQLRCRILSWRAAILDLVTMCWHCYDMIGNLHVTIRYASFYCFLRPILLSSLQVYLKRQFFDVDICCFITAVCIMSIRTRKSSWCKGRITYGLRTEGYFRVYRLKIAIFTHDIVIRFAVVASQICEITRNSEKIQTYSSSRSSKVINRADNRKRICKFLLAINSNIGRISYRFRDIDA